MKIFLIDNKRYIIFEDSLFVEADVINREEVSDTLVINGVKIKGVTVKRKYKKRKLGKLKVAKTLYGQEVPRKNKTQEEWIEVLNYSEEHSVSRAAKQYGVSASGISLKKKQFKDKRVWAPPGEEFRESGGAGPGPINDYRCQNDKCNNQFKSNLSPEKAFCPVCRVPVQA